MKAPRNKYRWFIKPDPKTNRILSDRLGQSMATAEYPGMLCCDGERRDLLEVPSAVVDDLAAIQEKEELWYQVFRKFGENLPRLVKTYTVEEEVPQPPTVVPPQVTQGLVPTESKDSRPF